MDAILTCRLEVMPGPEGRAQKGLIGEVASFLLRQAAIKTPPRDRRPARSLREKSGPCQPTIMKVQNVACERPQRRHIHSTVRYRLCCCENHRYFRAHDYASSSRQSGSVELRRPYRLSSSSPFASLVFRLTISQCVDSPFSWLRWRRALYPNLASSGPPGVSPTSPSF